MHPRDAVLAHYAACPTCETGEWCELADRLERAEVLAFQPREGASSRLCGVCQQRGTGHNARTCPQRTSVPEHPGEAPQSDVELEPTDERTEHRVPNPEVGSSVPLQAPIVAVIAEPLPEAVVRRSTAKVLRRIHAGLRAPLEAPCDGPWRTCVAGDPWCPCTNGVEHLAAT